MMALLLAAPFISGCKRKAESVAGNHYEFQNFWTSGPGEYNIQVDFNKDKSMTFVNDTASLTGTWNAVEEVLLFTLNNPPNNTAYRGTFDKDGISGNMRDELGDSGIFYGARIK